MNNRWFRSLLFRRILIIALLLLQALTLFYFISSSSKTSAICHLLLNIISIFTVLYIISKREKGAYKLTWIILILVIPLFGGILYYIFNYQTTRKKMAVRIRNITQDTQAFFQLPGDACADAQNTISSCRSELQYLQSFAGFPVYSGTSTEFLPSGEVFLKVLLQELDKAEKYIFLEYFIIQEGIMWNQILTILKKKAASGVIVRIIYDDIGCFLLLPDNYPQQLKKYGIECTVFNPFRPILSAEQNNRDHRKIVIIDGKTAFTGGINLADEYINARERHGHWKDSAIFLKGKAAWSLTIIFLQMWELCKKTEEDLMFFYPYENDICSVPDDGYVQPYADSPMDNENIGEHVYLQMINHARDYLYINTPYLIIDDSLVSALILAAKSGVDIRIITPHKWDRWLVHMTTRSYYRELIKGGIKIYEYSKGFNHSKTFVSDDRTATIGTTNMDFRSLYLHFECGVKLYKSSAVLQVKEDFLNTLPSCQQITEKDCQENFLIRLFQDILRLFAPLM